MRLGRFPALCAFLLVVSGCATIASITNPEIHAVRSRITEISFEDVHLLIDVDIHNPYPFVVTTAASEFRIDIQEQMLLTGEIIPGSPLPAKKVGTISFPARIAYSDLARLTGGSRRASEWEYAVHGFARTPVMGTYIDVPFTHRGKFPVLRPPAFYAVKVQLADVSLSRAIVIAEAEIENPNAFVLDLKELTYVLNLGSATVEGLKASSESTVAAGTSGRMTLVGEISAASGLIQVLMNGVPRAPELEASGLLLTPYGKVRL